MWVVDLHAPNPSLPRAPTRRSVYPPASDTGRLPARPGLVCSGSGRKSGTGSATTGKNFPEGLIRFDRAYIQELLPCEGRRRIQSRTAKSKLAPEGDRYDLGPQQPKETWIVGTDEEFLFDWHTEKRRSNITKHGVDFTRAIEIFSGITVEKISVKSDEVRFKATGYCEGIPLTVIYTWRGRKRRIISARRAKRNERREYREHVPE